MGEGSIALTREMEERWGRCTACAIGRYAHEHVFYRGAAPCTILFIGEAPGKTEDLLGVPFCGKSGEILNAMIKEARATGKVHNSVRFGITNVVACRPCDEEGGPNRAPNEGEIRNCFDRLNVTVARARPKGVVALGRVAHSACKKNWIAEAYPYTNLYHPAYILRSGGVKSKAYKKTVEDLIMFVRQVNR